MEEDGVVALIHGISGSNHAVHLQRPLEVFQVGDFDGADLHGAHEDGVHWLEARRGVCKEHRTEQGCTHTCQLSREVNLC